MILPILIKFGAEKSRIISIIIFVSVFGGAMLITQLARIWARAAGSPSRPGSPPPCPWYWP